MAKNDVQDFIELRHGFQGMADFSEAALRFLDRFGIAGGKAFRPSSNGASRNGAEHLREQVKRHYKKRRKHHPKPGGYSVNVLEQRRTSLKVLEALDRDEPRPAIEAGRRSMGSLVRRGYAKKVRPGLYTRTSKPYYVNRTGEQAASEPAERTSSDVLTVTQAAKRLKMSDSFVRILIQKGKLSARKELVPVKGRKPQKLLVLNYDDVARYAEATK